MFRLVIAWRGLSVFYGLFILAASISGNQARAREWLALAWVFRGDWSAVRPGVREAGHDPS